MQDTIQAIIDNCTLFSNSVGGFIKTENHNEMDMLKLLKINHSCKILKMIANDMGEIFDSLERK